MKQASHENTNTTWLYLCEIYRVVKYIEQESEMVVVRGWEGENGSYYLMGYRALQDENILETDYTTIWIGT